MYADGTVYFSSEDRHVYAVDTETATVSQTIEFPDGASSVAIDDGKLFVDLGSAVDEYDAESLEQTRQFETGREFAVTDDRLYLGGTEIRAIERASGDEIWTSQDGFGYGRAFNVSIGGGVVLFGAVSDYVENTETEYRTKDARVFALDAETGEKLWHFDNDVMLEYDSIGLGLLAHESGTGVVTISDGTVIGLSLEDGSKRWEETIERSGSGNIGLIPFALGESVCVCTGSAYGLAPRTGERRWQVGSDIQSVYERPPVRDDVAYVHGDGEVVGVGADGSVATRLDVANELARAKVPAVGDDAIYVAYANASVGAVSTEQ